ncbi:drug resistance transporter, EmrB/QacA subfamily [Actinacidiphila yanglinensis]|uniref:Drug resistance transporter, EmrB/QacA subfamily n=1 Tax=Actinacidiphila yanglinensis TaxID=310779 RepID=A0A1H6E6G6_9ACTN|nr:MFS transporter [Actinacidiphila yanglinensis]SEG93310.1 drug resistance transporter, EmrB/QacA subfamily [Actinacidiphila yanglinensis]
MAAVPAASAALAESSAPPPPAASPRRWLALAALTLSVLIIGLDGTVINVALPTLSGELGASSAQLQWIGGGYLLALSVVMLPVGLLGDRYGHKRLLIGGITLFGLASLAGAKATSPDELIAVRTVLGAGAAMIMPLSMAILPRIFSRQELPKAIATWTAATALGMPVGPLVGGWLLNHFWWGSVFVFNVPVAAIALVAAVWLLPGDRTGRPRSAAPFDIAGTVLSAVGITALVYGTILVPDDGWGSPKVLAGIVGGALVLAAFMVRQRRTAHPLVDLKLFADRAFRWGTLLAVFVNFAVMGILFVVPQYLQSVLGHDAFGTGLRILPLIVGLMLAATLSEPIAKRFGPRLVIPAGLLLLAAGALLGATTGADNGYGFAAVWLSLIGFGFGSAMVPATSLVMGSLPAERSGQGTSLLETVQQVGGVLGVAALGSILSAGYLGRLSVSHLDGSTARAARDSVTGADAVAARLHDPALLASAHSAFVHGLNLVLLTCGACSLLAAVLGLFLLPRGGRADGAPASASPSASAADDPGTGRPADVAGPSDTPAGVVVRGTVHGESGT